MTIMEFISCYLALLAYGAFFVVTLAVAFAPVVMAGEGVLAYNSNRSEAMNTACLVLYIVLHVVCFAGVVYLFHHCLIRLPIQEVANSIEQTFATIF